MAPHHSQDVPRNPGGKFNSQRCHGSVVIDLPSGYSLVLSRTKVASTGMGRLLAEGLRQNEPLYWTIRASFEGSEIDQIYCARIDKPPQRALSYTPSDHADHGSSYTYHLRPYDEPSPYSLHGRRDIESIRRRSLCDNPLYSTSYEERARRSSLAYEQLPLPDDPGPSQTVQDSYDDVPPPYTNRDSLPPYASSSGD